MESLPDDYMNVEVNQMKQVNIIKYKKNFFF